MTNNLSAGTPVRALDFVPAVQSFQDTQIGNISDTSYTTGDPECGVWVMAPSSGRVAVALSAGTRNNSANADRVFLTYRVFQGDPLNDDLIISEEAQRGLSIPGTQADQYQYHGHLTVVDGLTPGSYYYFQARHRTTLGLATADIAYRALLVFPVA